MNASTMWKAPNRREYKPKPTDPGQRIEWIRTLGEWKPEGGWQPRKDVTRTGVIWSDGPYPHSWWVVPDGGRTAAAVLIRTARRRDYLHSEGTLFQDRSGDHWRVRIRRAENVRARGIFPAIERTEAGSYDYCSRRKTADTHTVVWHADRECPDAAGKERFAGGPARNYRGPDYAVWTAGDVARALMGLVQVGCSPTPFCARCILLDPSLASVHSCASVTA